jgi:hypothetical protein
MFALRTPPRSPLAIAIAVILPLLAAPARAGLVEHTFTGTVTFVSVPILQLTPEAFTKLLVVRRAPPPGRRDFPRNGPRAGWHVVCGRSLLAEIDSGTVPPPFTNETRVGRAMHRDRARRHSDRNPALQEVDDATEG